MTVAPAPDDAVDHRAGYTQFLCSLRPCDVAAGDGLEYPLGLLVAQGALVAWHIRTVQGGTDNARQEYMGCCPDECNRKVGAPRKRHRNTNRMNRQPHRARPAQPISGEAAPERSDDFVVSRLCSKSPQDGPPRGHAVSLAYHTAITNWASPPGPDCPDLVLRAHAGPT